MNRIRLLPEHVANQIAAGEVVERPASVVKELVENSLDAQSTKITVEIQAGGRSLIRVIDDGVGMSRDDALLCLERHATSKIKRAEDLSSIATMGFRGEALPSIASVSRFTLTTRERDSQEPEGTQVIVEGGKIAAVKAAGSACGTSIEVRQLFFNLPARRKFLRSQETESAHIQHYLTLAALAYPRIGFEFIKDTRLVWRLPPVKLDNPIDAVRERMRALSGGEQNLLAVDFRALLPTAYEEPEPDGSMLRDSVSNTSNFRVWGLIGAPGVSRATREDQHVFVNQRPVENRGINFALIEGYHTTLMKGRFPVCCLFIELNPAEVDVNIHPAKREVKFHREKAIREFVARAVRETILGLNTQPSLGRPSPPEMLITSASAPPKSALTLEATVPPPPKPEPTDLPNFPKLSKPLSNWPTPLEPPIGSLMGTIDVRGISQTPSPGEEGRVEGEPQKSISPAATQHSQTVTPSPAHAVSSFPAPTETASATPLLQVPLRLIGVLSDLYVVLESDRGLVLLDQHAAHERVLFEQMLRRMEEQGTAPSQRLLLPETIELSARDANFLREQLPVLTRLGVGLSEFGERTFLLDALPPFAHANEPRSFILEIIDELKVAGQTINSMRLGEHVIAKTVCRNAVKAHDPLTGVELENLIRDLRHCTMPYTCPHGRPTLIEMSFRELEKKFGRTQ